MWLTLGKAPDKFKHLFERVANRSSGGLGVDGGATPPELSVPADELYVGQRAGRSGRTQQSYLVPRPMVGSNTRSPVLGKTSPMRYKSNIRSIERLFDIS